MSSTTATAWTAPRAIRVVVFCVTCESDTRLASRPQARNREVQQYSFTGTVPVVSFGFPAVVKRYMYPDVS